MTVKARNRLVSFRLSGEELENLRIACLLQGARNVSEFARSAVLASASPRVQAESQILDRLAGIETHLKEHSDLLRALLKNLVAERDRDKGDRDRDKERDKERVKGA